MTCISGFLYKLAWSQSEEKDAGLFAISSFIMDRPTTSLWRGCLLHWQWKLSTSGDSRTRLAHRNKEFREVLRNAIKSPCETQARIIFLSVKRIRVNSHTGRWAFSLTTERHSPLFSITFVIGILFKNIIKKYNCLYDEN